jgi:hypothetical protein
MKLVPLFGLRLRHDYHPDGICRDVKAEPTARTRRQIARHRLRLRELPDGFDLSAPLAADGKGLLVAVPPGELFEFELRPHNADFALFTDLAALADKSDPVYTNAKLGARDGPVLRLAERKPPRARDAKVLAGVELRCDKSVPADGAPFEIRLKARAARWAYYVVTDRGTDFSIVDAAGRPELAFGKANRTLLNKNPDAEDAVAAALSRRYPALQRLRFLSDQPIACSSAPRRGIELHDPERKVLESLPAPSIHHLSKARRKGASRAEETLHQVIKHVKAD